MKTANKFFGMGVLLALLFFSLFTEGGFLNNVYAALAISRLPRELRLGNDIDLISLKECSKRSLRSRIKRGSYGKKLAHTLNLLGATELEKFSNLKKTGIFNSSNSRSSITRKAAIESLCRAAIYLNNKNIIKLSSSKIKNYRDYKAPEKYHAALNFLQTRFVIRGYPDGRVGVNRRLTNKEAIFFLFRFYEAVSASLMVKNTTFTGIRFVDVPLNHPVMKKIKELTFAGAFDKVILRPCFDGNSFISVKETVEMIEGILVRQNIKPDQIRFKTIVGEKNSYQALSRRELALLLEYLLSSSGKNTSQQQSSLYYMDVEKDSPEFEALALLANNNITMGYANRKFIGHENVTWYETVGLIYEALKQLNLTEPEKPKDRLAKRSDIKSLTDLLRAKREKIRKILSRRPRYKRR